MQAPSYSEEEPSPKCLAIVHCFERLVVETENKSVREVTEKVLERGAINVTQNDNVRKTLSQHHLEANYSASLLFKFVLSNVQRDDRHFDRLVLALRDLEMDGLADELLKPSKNQSSPDNSPGPAREPNGTHHAASTDAPIVDPSNSRVGEDVSFCDSGINATLSTTNSKSASFPSVRKTYSHSSQPKLELNEPMQTSPDPQCTSPLQGSSADEGDMASTPDMEPRSNTPIADFDNNSLQPQPRLQEPVEVDETADNQPAPIQVHSELSNAVLLVPDTGQHYLSLELDVGGSSSEQLVDQLTHRLTQMRLELQHKERELQAREQEVQQTSKLLLRCQDLEEKLKVMEEEMKKQKQRAHKVSSDKDIEINCWKKKCEEKEHEIIELREMIAEQEQEKDRLTKTHVAEILKLKERQEGSARKVESYKLKVAALDTALKEATQRKEEAEQQLKEADSKIQQAEAERYKAEIKLLHSVVAKEKELSQLKDANNRLELEIKDLEYKNQTLVMKGKDKEVLLHQKDKELAEHKLKAAEEKHDSCVRELRSERRQSQSLKTENHQLKRQLSEFQERCLDTESPAKRPKTE